MVINEIYFPGKAESKYSVAHKVINCTGIEYQSVNNSLGNFTAFELPVLSLDPVLCLPSAGPRLSTHVTAPTSTRPGINKLSAAVAGGIGIPLWHTAEQQHRWKLLKYWKRCMCKLKYIMTQAYIVEIISLSSWSQFDIFMSCNS